MFFNAVAFGVLTILYCVFTFYVVSNLIPQKGEERFSQARFGGGMIIGLCTILKALAYDSPSVFLLWLAALAVVVFLTCILEVQLAAKKAAMATALFLVMLGPGCLLICSSFEL